jgi:large subunit ribosomal protein L20
MSRVTFSVPRHKRKKKLFRKTKGYTTGRKNLLRTAEETLTRGLVYQFRDRKAQKRQIRGLWITRISIASKENGSNYSQLTRGLKKADIRLNRKILADLAVNDKETFKQLVEMVKKAG